MPESSTFQVSTIRGNLQRDLTALRVAHSKETRIAELEAAIFSLTRQLVRSLAGRLCKRALTRPSAS